jgi:hypothetical protein
MVYIPSAIVFTIILIVVIMALLLFPSILAWWAKRQALQQVNAILKQGIDKGETTETLDKIVKFYATSTDVEGITASTRMVIATIALLIVGIGLFELIEIMAITMGYFTFDQSTNFTIAAEQANYSQNLIQLVATILGILGGVLSAAVGFFFGSKVSASQDQTAFKAEANTAAKIEVEKAIAKIEAEKAAKIEAEKPP